MKTYTIYRATHKNTGKIYIGYTSKSLQERIGQHWGTTENNRQVFQQFLHTTLMQDWTWDILRTVSSYKEARDCEMYYIKQLNAYEYGLNCPTGFAAATEEKKKQISKRMAEYRAANPEPWNKGRKGCYSEETLELMRIAKLKNPSRTIYTPEMKKQKQEQATNRKIIKELKTNQEFPSITAAAKHFNLRREAVRDVVNGKRTHTSGFIFVEVGNETARKKGHADCEACPTGIDYYMIQNELWAEINQGNRFLCLPCVEKRLGRKLKLEDFTNAPVNKGMFGFNAEDWVRSKQ